MLEFYPVQTLYDAKPEVPTPTARLEIPALAGRADISMLDEVEKRQQNWTAIFEQTLQAQKQPTAAVRLEVPPPDEGEVQEQNESTTFEPTIHDARRQSMTPEGEGSADLMLTLLTRSRTNSSQA
jgi:hypothetical protein